MKRIILSLFVAIGIAGTMNAQVLDKTYDATYAASQSWAGNTAIYLDGSGETNELEAGYSYVTPSNNNSMTTPVGWYQTRLQFGSAANYTATGGEDSWFSYTASGLTDNADYKVTVVLKRTQGNYAVSYMLDAWSGSAPASPYVVSNGTEYATNNVEFTLTETFTASATTMTFGIGLGRDLDYFVKNQVVSWKIEEVSAGGQSTAAEILSFELAEQTGAATFGVDTINIEVEYGTDLTNLDAIVTISDAATIDTATMKDFSSAPDTLVVTAEDQSTKNWIINVTEKAPLTGKEILTFTFAEQTSAAVFSSNGDTISIEVANGTDLTNLDAIVTISDAATIDTATMKDFSSAPDTLTVIAQDGTAKEWIINVAEAASLSGENDITAFTFAEQTGEAEIDDTVGYTVKIQVANSADIMNLTPSISVSAGAEISPLSGTAQDFSNTVNYVVKAQNGDEQTWKVIVSVESMLGASADGSAWISNNWNWNLGTFSAGDTITMSLTGNGSGDVAVNIGPFAPWAFIDYIVDSVVTDLFVKDTIDVKIKIPETAKSYDYLISENGYAGNGYYVLQALEAGGRYCNFKFFITDNNSITKFSLTEDASINEGDSTISIEVPYATDVTKLSPVIEVSEGAMVSPASGVETDFTNSVTYSVTGSNGALKEYVVTVTKAAPKTGNDIESFTFAKAVGSALITDTVISINVESGTNVSDIIPIVTVSEGATIDTADVRNFSGDVVFTVTAEDGSIQEWVIKTSVLTSVNDIVSEEIAVYPNPSSGEVNIEVTEGSSVVVVDITGSVVFKQDIVASGIIYLNGLSTGMYVVYVNSFAVKLIVE